MFNTYEFGYSWFVGYGAVIPLAIALLVGTIAVLRGWRRWITGLAGIVAVWALVALVVVNVTWGLNRPMAVPNAFLESGNGRVLDVGAGSGRAAVGVLLRRPRAHVTGVDIYSGYWGIDDNTPERFMRNARIAGAADRADARVGDMRKLPFEDQSFDGVVSSYAIDHLNREGVERTLSEVTRVLRPDGQFLMMVVNPDIWTKVALPFFHGHGYFGARTYPERWRSQLTAAGLEVVEEGTQPAALYFLAEKRRVHGSAKTYTAPPSGTSGY